MRSDGATRGGRAAQPPARPDLETRATPADHDDLRLWLRIMTVHKLIANEIRGRLHRCFSMTLPRFDLMAQLERSADGIRVGRLSEHLMVSVGNVSQLVDQLEREGLVTRSADPRNRRASLVALTAAGRKSFGRAAQAHEVWIVELFAGLSPREKRSLLAVLAKQKSLLVLSATKPPNESAGSV